MILGGWGRYPVADCRVADLRDETGARDAVLRASGTLIARGQGRSYGDAALNPAGTLLTRRLNRFLAFDPQTGDLTCESGVLLDDILSVFVRRGWFPPVTPGTRQVSLGGMIAADVHGKNHHQAGPFCRHIRVLDLMLADGRVVTCSPDREPGLFRATCGGMGLTGIILRATVRLMPIETAWIRQRVIRCASLSEVMAAFAAAGDASYSVAWIDGLSGGGALGRSVLFLGEHARRQDLPPSLRQHPLRVPEHRRLSVPVPLPGAVLSPSMVRLFNGVYFRRAQEGTGLVDLDSFFYPLDAVRHWNRIYGRRGFVQFQCVLPLAASAEGLARLLAVTAAAGLGSFLSVLKLFGPGPGGMLSFPMEGYTLALDFPLSAAVPGLLRRLEAIVCDHGGRLYLAKDALMTPQTFRSGYPELPGFLAERDRVGATGCFSSLQSQRVMP